MSFDPVKKIGRPGAGKAFKKPGFALYEVSLNDAQRNWIIRQQGFSPDSIFRFKDNPPGGYDAGDIQILFSGVSWEYASRAWSSGGQSFELDLRYRTYSTFGAEIQNQVPVIESADCDLGIEISRCVLPGALFINQASSSGGYNFEQYCNLLNDPSVETICRNDFSGRFQILFKKDKLIEINAGAMDSTVKKIGEW